MSAQPLTAHYTLNTQIAGNEAARLRSTPSAPRICDEPHTDARGSHATHVAAFTGQLRTVVLLFCERHAEDAHIDGYATVRI